MKRFGLTLVAALALTLSLAGTASASHLVKGTPGETNCKGLSTAWMSERDIAGSLPGLGNHARHFGITVTQLQARISTRLCEE